MAKKAGVVVTTSFHLGDRVRIKDLVGQVGRIAELRGPLGPGGAAVYRVKIKQKPRSRYIELLGNQIEPLPGVLPDDQQPRPATVANPQAVPEVSETS